MAPESDFPAYPLTAGQQVCRKSPRKPGDLLATTLSRERDAQGSWRRECARIRTVAVYESHGGGFTARDSAEWLIEKNGNLSQIDPRAARLDTSFRRAA